MNRKPLLLALLLANVALLAIIGGFVHEESVGSFPSLTIEKSDLAPVAVKTSPSLAARTTESHALDAIDYGSTTTIGIQPEAGSAAGTGGDIVARREPKAVAHADPIIRSPNDRSGFPMIEGEQVRHESPVAPLPASIPRWVTHPRAQVRFGLSRPDVEEPNASRRDPAVENVPTASEEPKANASAEANHGTAVIAVAEKAMAESAAIGELQGTRRPAWPRGSFTPEEELYRAQYGWAALSQALREEALGPSEP